MKGFTLVETIMSIIIISISALGLFTVYNVVLAPKDAPQPHEITRGTQLIQEGLENVIADRKSKSRGYGYIVAANYPAENLPDGYIRTTAITSWPVNPDTNQYKQVNIIISHRARNIPDKQCSYLINYYRK